MEQESVNYWISVGEQRAKGRIIKLLEAECERPLDPKWEHYRETCSCAQIALIKGENKPFITAKQAEELTDEMLEE